MYSKTPLSSRSKKPKLPINDPNSCWSMIKDSQSFQPLPYIINPTNNKTQTKSIRIACISDTHGKHRSIPIPSCDILIHSGDITQTGEIKQISDLSSYFKDLKGNQIVQNEIICIAGNHDVTLHTEYYKENWKTFHPNNGPLDYNFAKEKLSENCIYLEDELYSLTVATDNDNSKNDEDQKEINVYGSPWSPTICNWAFNSDREVIHKKWDMIVSKTQNQINNQPIDILITHGPPLGRNDLCRSTYRVGCLRLLEKVQQEIKPRIHIFGHIHEDAGCSFDGQTLFVNASSLSLRYQPTQPCIVIDLPLDKTINASIVKPYSNLDGDGVLTWLNQQHHHDDGDKIFKELIPFFENQSPLLTGEDIIHRTDFMRFACELKMDKDPNWLHLVKQLGQVVLQLNAESY
jgi:Icc-related predicted phosphoesterase